MADFVITPVGPFSLAEAAQFLTAFTPHAHSGGVADHLHLAVPDQPAEQGGPVGVCLRQPGDRVEVDVLHGEATEASITAVERMLSLDCDARGFEDVGRTDEVIGRMLGERPGFRPVGFSSPWEAAVWAVLSQRMPMARAAALRTRIATGHGTVLDLHGQRFAVLPPPRIMADVAGELDLGPVREARLRAVADAAVDGLLDADHLRATPPDQALSALREIHGIGPFGAELILLRGAMTVDVLPVHEPRLQRAICDLYDIHDAEEALAHADRSWRPWRTWSAVLLRSNTDHGHR